MRTTTAVLAGILAMGSPAVLACDRTPLTPREWVKRLDRDKDGGVSKDEFDGPAEHFSDFDTNGDGFIAEQEAPKGPPPGRGGHKCPHHEE